LNRLPDRVGIICHFFDRNDPQLSGFSIEILNNFI
jgi:hypothetical protein